MAPLTPDLPVTAIRGVGPAFAEKLAKLGIRSVMDLMVHLPFRYEDRTKVTRIGACRAGDTVVLEGEVVACNVGFGRRRSLLAMLQDGTGTIGLRFYHFSRAQQENLKNAGKIRCYGEVRNGASGFEIYHPEYERSVSDELEASLTPVYPVTEGVSQARLRSIISGTLDSVRDFHELTPGSDGPGIEQALRFVHQPPPAADTAALESFSHPMQQKLITEELLAHQVSIQLVREEAARWKAPRFAQKGAMAAQLIDSLPFNLTGAQNRVVQEIREDLASDSPSLRLVQGDVGSGKTIVAALAMLQAIESGYQAAFMAPTEILAEQHMINLAIWLAPLGVRMAWLSGKVKGKARTQELGLIASGDAQVVVGTHALFQDDVQFAQLGLVIVDEQHRFGVHQRMALRDKGGDERSLPHQLVMTATPIPRTLTMSLYATMDCSVIDELPAGRKPVTTTVMSNARRDEIVARVHDACRNGAQAYWVCTLIEESEALSCEAAEDTAASLSSILTDIRVGLVHGRMKPDQKQAVMTAFKQGDVDLLVATTVIEVGVDVPNASLMVIENAERLGLTQLHQLRGRVGRGERESHCVLMYQAPLTQTGKRRLGVMRDSNDGFWIAEQDLAIRGPGDILGARQSGMTSFRIADLLRDSHLLESLAPAAGKLLAEDRQNALALVERWLDSPADYGQV